MDYKKLGVYFKAFFTKGGLDRVPKNIIKSHHFILMRYLSIKYPIQVCNLHVACTDPYVVSMYMHRIMANMYTRVPDWVWIKYNKEHGKLYDKLKKLKPAIIYYKRTNLMGTDSFYYAVRNNPDHLLSELKKYDKYLKDNDIEVGGNFKLALDKIY